MAAEEELRWCFVHEEILSNISTGDAFFNAINIWVERPQVLNRRLLGSCILQSFLTRKCGDLLSQVFAVTRENGIIFRDDLLGLVKVYERNINDDNDNVVEVKIRSLFPRESSKYCRVLEMIIQDENSGSVIFIPFEEEETTNKLRCNSEHAYQVSFLEKKNSQSLSISVVAKRKKGNGITCPTVEWLKTFLLPRLHKWMIEDGSNTKFSLGQSLSLVSVEKYSKKYEDLKQKYKHFVKMWPERTDPHKFVYEDVAIATYLLLLWELEENETNFRPQKFVDLGCGNGLLVHILTNEGHLGKGVDLRSRKVWKFYDNKTVLEVSSLDPSSQTYLGVDWLIGNHSDELTPWIPVMAARSSYNCKYFVLPCCFHDFYCKFQRANSNERQYRSYLDYVENIGKTCGFNVQEDVLRIPSTKKVCQIGQTRTYSAETQELVEAEITKMLENARYGNESEAKRTLYHNATKEHYQILDDVDGSWSSHDNTQSDQSKASREFIPRCNTEPVQNCTKVDKNLLDEIVRKVVAELLSRTEEEERTVDCKVEDGGEMKKTWNKGGCMELSEISELFDQNVLGQLRSEAGGIKTVLRNSHQIFKVQGGTVRIRDWREDSHCKKQDKKKHSGTEKYWKTKPCWFHAHHPDGCPLVNEQCSFAHGTEDLRTLP